MSDGAKILPENFNQPYIDDGVFAMYKNRCETPLEAIERFRLEKGLGAESRLTYLGRLDPMAEGLLLVGVNVTQEIRGRMLSLEKTYEVTILCGVSTDTSDVLGLIKNSSRKGSGEFEINPKSFHSIVGELKMITSMPYHDFSSKPIDGMPSFEHAKVGSIPAEKPEKNISITNVEFMKSFERNWKELVEEICADAARVSGDFRQEEIIAGWKKLAPNYDLHSTAQMFRIKVSASSGAYMRSIVDLVSERFKLPMLAYSIIRTQIGLISL